MIAGTAATASNPMPSSGSSSGVVIRDLSRVIDHVNLPGSAGLQRPRVVVAPAFWSFGARDGEWALTCLVTGDTTAAESATAASDY